MSETGMQDAKSTNNIYKVKRSQIPTKSWQVFRTRIPHPLLGELEWQLQEPAWGAALSTKHAIMIRVNNCTAGCVIQKY